MMGDFLKKLGNFSLDNIWGIVLIVALLYLGATVITKGIPMNTVELKQAYCKGEVTKQEVTSRINSGDNNLFIFTSYSCEDLAEVTEEDVTWE